jgi:taurine dioxygenase
MQIVPNSGGVGAEIMGVDPARLSDAGFDVVYRAWLEHSVLLFREPTLSDAELSRLARLRRTGSRTV